MYKCGKVYTLPLHPPSSLCRCIILGAFLETTKITTTDSTPLKILRDIGNWSSDASFNISFGFKKNTGDEESVYVEVNKNSKQLLVYSTKSAPLAVGRDVGSFSGEAPVCLEFFAKTTSANNLIGYFQVNKNSGELYWYNNKTGTNTKLA